jgi:hypothetical protein
MNKKIIVRHSVLAAARRLQDLSEQSSSIEPIDLAELKIYACQAAADMTGLIFWRRVWIHLMAVRHCGGEIQIIEDDNQSGEARLSAGNVLPHGA